MKFTLTVAILPALLVAYSAPAYSVQYLSVEEAQKILFPKSSQFVSSSVALSHDDLERFRKLTGERLYQSEFSLWKAQMDNTTQGYFMIDEVLGKHEMIRYAVGFDSDKKIIGVEILEYRETHGFEIKDPEWREQFVGKSSADKLKLGKDIKNISGATLSCIHVTEGIRKLSFLMEVAFAR